MVNTPELEGPRYKVLNLVKMKEACSRVLGWEPERRTIRGAYEEVLGHLLEEGRDLPFFCGKCNAQIDGKMEECWACGAKLQDSEDPEVTVEELRDRAAKLSLEISESTPLEELRSRVEDAEREKRRRTRESRADLAEMESKRINEKLSEAMGTGWTKRKSIMYTTYFDPGRKRRIAVYHRGLQVMFAVEDGDLDGVENVRYFDPEERKRCHMGRSNYVYVGEISREAVEVAKRVLRRYSE